MCYQANTYRQGSLFPGDIMILICSSFFPFFLPFLKSISGINMLHSKSCKESVFLQSAALLAALLQPICESTVCDQIRCTTRCLFCCPGVEHQEPLDCDQSNNSEQIRGNKHNHPYHINHSLTGNPHLDFSEFRAHFFIISDSLVILGSWSRIHPRVRVSAKVKASPECHWHVSAACALCIYPLQNEVVVRSCRIWGARHLLGQPKSPNLCFLSLFYPTGVFLLCQAAKTLCMLHRHWRKTPSLMQGRF